MLSLGVALSPVPVAVALLMLPKGEGPNRVPAFLFGWTLAILVLAMAVLLAPGLESSSGAPTDLSGYLRVALGLVLLVLAVRQWKLRPPPGTEPQPPRFFRKLTGIGFCGALVIGAVSLAANPVNLAMVAAAANVLDTSLLNVTAQTIVLTIFIAGASSTIALPLIGYWIFQERAEQVLGRARDLLLRHNHAIVCTLLFALGVLLVSNGMQIVLSS